MHADKCVVENGPDIECNGVCGIDFLTGRPYCDPSCDIDNGGCSDDEVCVPAETVFCIRAPCPQGIRCIHKTGEAQYQIDVMPTVFRVFSPYALYIFNFG